MWFLHVKFIADFRTMLMACSGRQFGLCRRFTYRTIIPPTPFRCTTCQEILHLRMYFCSIILARTQNSGMHFGWPARMTAHTSWVSVAYPLVLMCLWWMRVVTHCSQWPREWHLVQGSEVMRELNLKMSLLTTSVNLPTIRMPPPALLPHLCHPPCPSTNARRGGTLVL